MARTAGTTVVGDPRWMLTGGLAAAATALVCWPVWPGYMSYDSLLAYSQAAHGVRTATWPPLHSYLFAISRAAHADAWGLFAAQVVALLFSAGLVLSLVSRRVWMAVGLNLTFLASFLWVTPQLGVLVTQWRDVTTASFAVVGLALWLLGARSRILVLVVAAAGAFGCALALRYNAPPLIGPLVALMVWRPFLEPRPSRAARIVIAAAVTATFFLAWASTQWRLPDLRSLPAGHNAMVTQQFDLIGISACSGIDYLPPAMTGGVRPPGRAIARTYDPRHLNLSLRGGHGGPRLIKLRPSEANSRIVGRAWRRAFFQQPGCYFRHRTAVMREQFGLVRDHVFYPTHGGVDPNPFGIKLAHPKAAAQLNAWIAREALPMPRRVFWLYALALPLVLVAAWRRREQAALLGALLAGAWAYAALLVLAGPAADARYIFPSNIFCVLAILLSLGALVPRRLAG